MTFSNDFAPILARRMIIIEANFSSVITCCCWYLFAIGRITDDEIVLLLDTVTERLSVSKQVGREAGRVQPNHQQLQNAMQPAAQEVLTMLIAEGMKYVSGEGSWFSFGTHPSYCQRKDRRIGELLA